MNPKTVPNIIELMDQGALALDEAAGSQVRISLLGACPRRIALLEAKLVEPTRMDAKALRIVSLGTERGTYHAKCLAKAMHVAIFEEMPVSIDLGGKNGFVPGHIDALFVTVARDESIVIEFKTKNNFGWKKLAAEGIGWEYEAQVQGYIEGVNQNKEFPPCNYAVVIFENKDNGELMEFLVKRNTQVLNEHLTRLKDALENVQAGRANDVLPGPQQQAAAAAGERLHWSCSYCPVDPIRGKCFPKLTLIPRGERNPKYEIAK